MAINAQRVESVIFTGDRSYVVNYTIAANSTSPAMSDIIPIGFGEVVITIPTGTKCMIIVPPAGNTQTLKLKGIAADTGIFISKTEPTTIQFDTVPPANFTLTLGGPITNLRIDWI